MTKVYYKNSIIKISDNLTVIVDKEADGAETIGQTAYLEAYNIVSKITERIGNSCRDIILENMPHNGTLDYRQLRPVIATIGTERLEGIPVIEEVNEIDNIKSIFFKEFPIPKSHWPTNQKFDYESGRIAFIRGYKANTKQYTEEDMVNFACNVFNAYEGESPSNARKKDTNFYNLSKEMVKSLSKQINEVELEYIPSKAYQRDALCSHYELKIHNKETNSIKPIKIIYNG